MKKKMSGVVRLKSTVLWSSRDCSKNVGLCFSVTDSLSEASSPLYRRGGARRAVGELELSRERIAVLLGYSLRYVSKEVMCIYLFVFH